MTRSTGVVGSQCGCGLHHLRFGEPAEKCRHLLAGHCSQRTGEQWNASSGKANDRFSSPVELGRLAKRPGLVHGVAMERIERRPFPARRRFVLGALRAGRRMAPMSALVQVDVTKAWARLEETDLSPTAFTLACVGRAVAAHPEVHAYRDWLGRLAIHPHVNIATMIEVPSSTGPFPLAYVIRNTERRTVGEMSAELHAVKTRPRSVSTGQLLQRWGQAAGSIPGLPWLIYSLSKHSTTSRRQIGTVALSAVGMMLGGSGAVVSVMSLASAQVLVGAATDRPWVVDGEVVVRRILDLTVQVDHRVVDGGPAGRFGATLRSMLEDPDLVDW